MTSVLVCGLARCGTSLTMQMLQAGGFPVIGEYPAFEDSRFGIPRDLSVLLPFVGNRAVKIIDPHRSEWPFELNCKAIWLDRDFKQQAKSQCKFVSLISGLHVPAQAWRSVAKSLPKERAECFRILKRMPFLSLHFEEILKHPKEISRNIGDFLETNLDIDGMASVVLSRTSRCQPQLDIEMNLIARVSA